MISIVVIASLFSSLNILLVSFVNINIVFAGDIVIWVVLSIWFEKARNKKEFLNGKEWVKSNLEKIQIMKACFMGLGYIGLPTAIIAAKHGIQITGVDINPHVVEMTNAGHLHIIEPGMEKMLQEVVKTGMLKASVTPEVSDAYFMVVPTPFKGNHEPDVSYVEAATHAVLPLLKEGDLYVIESTSPVGTTEAMARIIFNERPELEGKIILPIVRSAYYPVM